MLGGESGNPHLSNVESADNRGKVLNYIARRRKVLSIELIYVVIELQLFMVSKVLLLFYLLLHRT